MSSRQYGNFKNWRTRAKAKLAEAFGSRCGICGYDRCIRNLAFHHVDPSEKEFGIAISGAKSWSVLVSEARKCVLLCANCHGEVHAGITQIPKDCARFNETFASWRQVPPLPKKFCVECDAPITVNGSKLYCSMICYRGATRRRHPRVSVEDLQLALNKHSWIVSHVAQTHGVSDTCVRKWAKSYGIALTNTRRKNGTPPRS